MKGVLPIRRNNAAAFLPYIIVIIAVLLLSRAVPAEPGGATVVSGSAAVDRSVPSITTVLQSSDKAIIEWERFGIDAGELVRFIQPSGTAATLNRITGTDPTLILGSLQANGRIFLVNPNGVVFGSSAQVDVGGLLATTLNIGNEDFLQGNFRLLQEPGAPQRAVVNLGRITATESGFVILAAPLVDNEGAIIARMGHVVLGATREAVVNFDGQGLINYIVPSGSASHGNVVMEQGACSELLRSVVNNGGLVSAGSIVEEGGELVLMGAEGVAVHAGAIDVKGGAGPSSGSVIIDSTQTSVTAPGSSVDAGGAHVSIAAQTLQISGNVGSPGGAVDYTADTMSLQGTTDTGAGRVSLKQLTGSRSIALGSEVEGALSLTGAEFVTIKAGTVVIGRTEGGGDIRIRDSVRFTSVMARALALRTGGGITQDEGKTLSVENLAIRSSGNVDLGQANYFLGLAAAVSGAGSALRCRTSQSCQVGVVDGLAGITTNGGGVELLSSSTIRLLLMTDTISTRGGVSADGSGMGGGDVTLSGWKTVWLQGGAILASGGDALAGSVARGGDAGNVRMDANTLVKIYGNITATGGSGDGGASAGDGGCVELNAPVQIGPYSIAASGGRGGSVVFDRTLVGGSMTDLVVNAGGGAVDFKGAVSLKSLSVTGNAITLQAVTTTGSQDYAGSTTLKGDLKSTSAGHIRVDGSAVIGGDVTVSTKGATGDDITFIGTIDGGNRRLVLNAGVGGGVRLEGSADNLESVSASGKSVTLHGVATRGSQDYSGAITSSGAMNSLSSGHIAFNGNTTLAADTSLQTQGGASDAITFNGAVDGPYSLELDAGAQGSISFMHAVGSQARLAGITITAARDVSAQSIAAGSVSQANGSGRTVIGVIDVSGAEGLPGGAVGINASGGITVGSVNASGAGGGVTVGSVNASGASGGSVALRSAGAVSCGAITADGAPAEAGQGGRGGSISLSSGGLLTVNGAVRARGGAGEGGGRGAGGDIAYFAETIAFNGATDADSGTFAVGTYHPATSISIDCAADGLSLAMADLNAVRAGRVAIGGLSDTGVIVVRADVAYTGSSLSLRRDVTLDGAAPIAISVGSGLLELGGRVDGAAALAVRAGAVSFAGSVGSTAAPSSLDVTASRIAVRDVSTSGSQRYAGDIVLDGDAALTSHHGGLVFAGRVDGAHGLMVDAGAGAAEFSGAVGSTAALASLDVKGGAIRASGPVLTRGSQAYTSDVLELNGGAGSIATLSGGALMLQPAADDGAISIGSGAAGTLSITPGILDALAEGFSAITIGRSDGRHAITVNASSFKDPVTLRAPRGGGSITVSGRLAGAAGASITVISAGDIRQNAGGDVITHGGDFTAVSEYGAYTMAERAPSAAAIRTAGGSVRIVAVDASIDTAAGIDAGSGTVTLASSGGVDIDLGTETAGRFSVSNAEVYSIKAGAIRIGGRESGNIVVTAALDVSHAGSLSLESAGSIAESAQGSITGAALALKGAAVTMGGSNVVGTIAAEVTGRGNGFVYTSPSALTVGAVGDVSGIRTADGPISLTSQSGDLAVYGAIDSGASETVLGTAAAGGLIAIAPGVIVKGNGAVTLTADRMDIKGSARSLGTVWMKPRTEGLPIHLGAAIDTEGALGFAGDELAGIAAGVLRIGAPASGAITIDADMAVPDAAAVSLVSGGSITELSGGISGNDLALQAAGAVMMDGSNRVRALAASVTGAGNAVTFRNFDNLRVRTVDGVRGIATRNGSVAHTSAVGGLEIGDDITAGSATISLTCAGPITEAGSLTAARLALRSSGAVNLGGAGNRISTVAAAVSGAGEAFNLVSACELTIGSLDGVDGISTNNGAITVAAGGNLTVADTRAPRDVNAGASSVALTSGAGGTLSIAALGNVYGQDSVTYSSDTLALIGRTATGAGGTVALRPVTQGRAIDIGARAAGALCLTSGDLATVSGGTLRIGSETCGNITLNASLSPSGVTGLSLVSGGSIASPSVYSIAKAKVGLQAGGSITLPGMNRIGTLAVRGTGKGSTVTVRNASALIVGSVDGIEGISSNDAELSLSVATGALVLDRSIDIGAGKAMLSVKGGLTESSGAGVRAGSLAVLAAGNVLMSQANEVGTLAASVTVRGKSLSFTNAGALAVGEVGALKGVRTVNAAITLATAGVNGGDLTVRNIGSALFDVDAGTATVSLSAGGGSHDLTVESGAAIKGYMGVTYSADRIALAGSSTNAGLTGTVALKGSSAGREIDLGTKAPDRLGITAAELNTLKAGALTIGDSTSGNIVISGEIAPSMVSQLSLVSGGGVAESAGGCISRAGLKLSVQSVGSVAMMGNNDVNSLAVNVSGAGSGLSYKDTNAVLVSKVGAVCGLGAGSGTVYLQAGDISQSVGAAISSANLGIISTGKVSLNDANSVDTLAARLTGAAGSFGFRNSKGLRVGAVEELRGILDSTGDVVLNVNGALEQDSSAPVVASAGNLVIRAAGPVTLANRENNVRSVLAGVSTGGFTYQDADSLAISGASYLMPDRTSIKGITVSSGSVHVAAGAGGAGGELAVGTVSARAGSVNLAAYGNIIDGNGAATNLTVGANSTLTSIHGSVGLGSASPGLGLSMTDTSALLTVHAGGRAGEDAISICNSAWTRQSNRLIYSVSPDLAPYNVKLNGVRINP